MTLVRMLRSKRRWRACTTLQAPICTWKGTSYLQRIYSIILTFYHIYVDFH